MSILNVCYNNLSALTVNGCTALRTFNIFCNQITEDNMTALVNSLPTVPAGSGTIRALYYTDEANVVTTAHVIAANQKGWNVQRNDGSNWVNIDTSFIRGDVNGDGTVNISDVTGLIDYILSGSASGVNVNAADCNQDGNVNISDVTSLIDMLLSNN
jgi:hypothetical protein